MTEARAIFLRNPNKDFRRRKNGQKEREDGERQLAYVDFLTLLIQDELERCYSDPVFALFLALAELSERELIRERTLAGLASARARGRKGGRPHALSKAQVRLAQAAMAQRDTKVSELCLELGVTKATIYRYVAPDGSLRNRGRQVLAR